MKATNKIARILRPILVLAGLLTLTTNASGYVFHKIPIPFPNPEQEIDGVRYMLDYYNMVWDLEYPVHYQTNPNTPEYRRDDISTYIDAKFLTNTNDFYFYNDESYIPAFQYHTKVVKPNTAFGTKLPEYDASKDEMLKRYPYYTGDVWLQDSVCMVDLPDHKKTRYHIVTDISQDCFNEKLISIRTPAYAPIEKGTFKDCTGLRTARIGTHGTVNEYAFENCTRLETVYFETIPKAVYDYVFAGCKNIKNVVIDVERMTDDYGESLLLFLDNAFDDEVYENATLYVREDQIECAKNDFCLGKFKNIKDVNIYYSGVDEVIADADVEYQVYNLSGVLVKTGRSGDGWRQGLDPGIYIVKSSLGKVTKEYIK